ncbi:hypothetical protein AVEN_172322-1 [Araneus ventricosus]|uniref:Uncharacterized protein n=1 Tax=Araneus ventricosus TaxID=182803 RepID=A0A4Y2E523_ARAVE|nr:hypothetical protein AVEN_172322-1 [Araneus ventricosus]
MSPSSKPPANGITCVDAAPNRGQQTNAHCARSSPEQSRPFNTEEAGEGCATVHSIPRQEPTAEANYMQVTSTPLSMLYPHLYARVGPRPDEIH